MFLIRQGSVQKSCNCTFYYPFTFNVCCFAYASHICRLRNRADRVDLDASGDEDNDDAMDHGHAGMPSRFVLRIAQPFSFPAAASLSCFEPRDIRSIYDQTATLCTAALLTAIITGLATRVRFQSHPSQSADIATGEDDDDKSAAAGDDGEEDDEEDTTPVTRFVKVVAVFSAIGGMLFG